MTTSDHLHRLTKFIDDIFSCVAEDTWKNPEEAILIGKFLHMNLIGDDNYESYKRWSEKAVPSLDKEQAMKIWMKLANNVNYEGYKRWSEKAVASLDKEQTIKLWMKDFVEEKIATKADPESSIYIDSRIVALLKRDNCEKYLILTQTDQVFSGINSLVKTFEKISENRLSSYVQTFRAIGMNEQNVNKVKSELENMERKSLALRKFNETIFSMRISASDWLNGVF